MNKLQMPERELGRSKRDALGRALRSALPVDNKDRDSSMDDVVDKLRRID